MAKKITITEYKKLNSKIDKMSGIKLKFKSFEKRMDKMDIKLLILNRDNDMLRHKIKRLEQKYKRPLLDGKRGRPPKIKNMKLGIRWIEDG